MIDAIEEEVARILLDVKAITLRLDPPYRWVSGILSPIYTDNRILMSYPQERKKVIDLFLKLIKEKNVKFDVVGGIESSGIPHAAWIAEKLGLPMIYIRKKTKDHGKENLIEGRLEKGKKVLVVEDLISTGGSCISGIQAVREAGGVVNHCLAIFTYGLEDSKKSFSDIGVELLTLTNFHTLVKTATEMKYIKDQEKEKILEWAKDPKSWGR